MASKMPTPGAMPANPAQMQQFLAQEAQRQGISPQQLIEKMQQQAMQQQRAQQAQGQGQGQSQQGPQRPVQGGSGPPPQGAQSVPLQPGPAKPEALAVAKFLKSQELKSRPCILNEKRHDMFKVKRAIRALFSPAYTKARSKNPLLPEVHDRASAENTFKMLPLSMLAIRISRVDPTDNPSHGQPGHVHGKKPGGPKGSKKGQPWVVRIEQHQNADDMDHYVWFYEGSQWKQKAYAVAALVAVIAIVLFPLWPLVLRQGVWYLSMGCLGLLGAFFGLAIVRLILFLITVAVGPTPGIWLYPNLFEDVGFFDSFRPIWDWRETKESIAQKKADKKAKKQAKHSKKELKQMAKQAKTGKKANGSAAKAPVTTAKENEKASTPAKAPTSVDSVTSGATTTGAESGGGGSAQKRRDLSAKVEEVEDE